jgi:hypothetical protein
MLELRRIIMLYLYYRRSSKPNPNLPKSGQAPAKASQRKSKKKPWIFLDFLRRIGPFQWVTATPRPKNSLSAPSFPIGVSDRRGRFNQRLGEGTTASGFRKENSPKIRRGIGFS